MPSADIIPTQLKRAACRTLPAMLTTLALAAGPLALATPPAPAGESGPKLAPPSLVHRPSTPASVPSPTAAGTVSVRARFIETRPASTAPASTADERRAEQVGRLQFARVELESDGAPLRDVLRAFRNAIGINLTVFEERVEDGTIVSGVDGTLPIDLALSDVSGFEVLDQLAALAGKRATWQIDGSVVQFGLKTTLKDFGKRTEPVEAADLALIAPDWIGPRLGEDLLKQLKAEAYNRLDSDQVLGDLARLISTHCEPEAFEPDPERAHSPPSSVQQHTPAKNGPGGKARTRVNPNTNAPYNFAPEVGPIFVHGKWASLQTHGTTLSLAGPDFVLRQIVGYPEPLAPRETASAEPAK